MKQASDLQLAPQQGAVKLQQHLQWHPCRALKAPARLPSHPPPATNASHCPPLTTTAAPSSPMSRMVSRCVTCRRGVGCEPAGAAMSGNAPSTCSAELSRLCAPSCWEHHSSAQCHNGCTPHRHPQQSSRESHLPACVLWEVVDDQLRLKVLGWLLHTGHCPRCSPRHCARRRSRHRSGHGPRHRPRQHAGGCAWQHAAWPHHLLQHRAGCASC